MTRIRTNNQPLTPKTSESAIAKCLEGAEPIVHILVVDDEPERRQALFNHLSVVANYVITQASNGAQALEILEKGLKPNLILLNVMMPNLTGYEVTRKIRETWSLHDLPIVLLGDPSQGVDWATVLASGANDYLFNSISSEELLFRLKIHINLSQLKAENTDLKILLDTSTEHGDSVVVQLQDQAEEAVRESERKLAQFLEAVPVGVGVLDANGKLYFLNQKAKDIFGKGIEPDTPPETLSQTYQIYMAGTNQLYPSQQLPIVRALQGESVTADDLEIHQGDKIIPIEVWATPIYDADGNIVYSINALQDITERKQTEKLLDDYNRILEQEVTDRTQELNEKNQQLQQEILNKEATAKQRQLLENKLRTSEKKMRAVFEAMTDIILVIDSQGNNIEVAPTNPGRLYEGTTHLVNQTIEQFLQGEGAEIWLSQIQEVIATQKTIDFDYSLNVGNQDVWFTASISPLPDGSILWVARNITARKQAEVALKQSEEKFARAFRSSPSAFTITRQSDGRHIEVNDSFCQFTGYTREEMVGRTALDLNLWVNWEDRDQLFKKLKKEGLIRNYEFNFRTKLGEVRTALLSAELIDLNGQIHIISVSQDITDRKQTQAVLQKAKEAAEMANLAKSRFLANMSHELRTPLNAILGFTQLLTRDSSFQPEQQNYIEIIQRSGEHLLELINNVLQLSKIEVGRITLTQNSFDLYGLLNTLEVMFQSTAQNKKLRLIFERDQTLPQYVHTDEAKLRQVLINLLGNALKFTSEGCVTLRVKRENQTSLTQTKIKFEVEDTGSGIAPEEMDALFEPFVQTETGRKSLEGTGLGLSITRQFVQLMGGDITVSSTLGKGSCFNFDIQITLAQASEIEITQITPKVIGLEPGQSEYRILVVDDRLDSRILLIKLLTSVGFSVQEAVNGQEAINLWLSWEPQLIWMDMRMPVMDGYEATKRIKSHLKGQATAIIALTASAFEEERSIILSAGCDDFVRKPFREEVIFEKMAQHIGVRYLYEEPALSSEQDRAGKEENREGQWWENCTPSSNPPMAPSDLTVMPAEWLNALYHAAISIENEQILQLIEQIPAAHSPLAKGIAHLVNNFRCDQIIDLIEEAKILELGIEQG